jgi:hypothetical protein
LVRFGARDYDPTLGRILFGGGQANLYVYAGNDPVNWVDYDGQCPLLIPFAIGAGAGALETAITWAAGATLVVAAGALINEVADDLNWYASEHTKGKRKSTADKHTKPRVGGPEKADDVRRVPRMKPDGHRGPWPPVKKEQ